MRLKTALWYDVLKRALDIFGAMVAIVFTSPFFILIPLLIKLDSKGPAFFFQKRCGKGNKEFKIFKFRSMVDNAEDMKKEFYPNPDSPFKMNNDPRLTRLGKFLRKSSLDEIPQFFNVLKGEMSLVGPRPLAAEEMEFNPLWRDMRLKVKPGITGLWQISARGETNPKAWMKYDLFYVQNRSIWLDIKILFKTFPVVFRGTGAV